MDWKLTSTAFAAGERIPAQYTGDGQSLSPPLSWTAPPADAQELILICDDPDAPSGTFTHWLLYGLSPQATSLPEGLPPQPTLEQPACRQGVSSARRVGYVGPAPPPGKPHRYQFTLYALSAPSGLPPGASKPQVESALADKVLAQTTLEGLYGR